MLKSVPILCRFKNLSVVLCVTLWYSNFSICLKLTHIVTYGNILEYLKPFLAGHQDNSQLQKWSCDFFLHFCLHTRVSSLQQMEVAEGGNIFKLRAGKCLKTRAESTKFIFTLPFQQIQHFLP